MGKRMFQMWWTGELEERVDILTDFVSVTISCPKCSYSKFNHVSESFWIK
jgi:hypothetical protein